MEFKSYYSHYQKQFKELKLTPPNDKWKAVWHGMFYLKEVVGEKKRQNNHQKNKESAKKFEGLLRGSRLEMEIFFNVLASIDKPILTMFELGAGRADWTCATAGTIRHQLIPTPAKNCKCLSLEGEPTHHKWCEKHVEINKINSICVHGAISSKNGSCFFECGNADNCYGHQICSENNNKKNLDKVKVNTYTIDYLMEKYNFQELDLLHMDVQEAEYDALLGAHKVLSEGRINYMIIATHAKNMNQRIENLLKKYPKYKILISSGYCCSKKEEAIETPFGKAITEGDGLMLVERKPLH